MTDRIDILGLGVAAVDDLLYLDSYPQPDEVTAVARRERHCGGLTTTALVAASRLGSRCAYAGVLGEDLDSEFVVQTLEREGIDVQCLKREEGARPIRSTILVDQGAKGVRTILCDLNGVQGAAPDHPAEALIAGAKILYVDNFGLDGMLRASAIANGAGVPVVGDFGVTQSDRLPELFELIDHPILSLDYAMEFVKAADLDDAFEKLWVGRKEVVVLTDGENGCWVRDDPNANAPRYFPAYPVDTVDTTGCGDVFHGAYASVLARGMELDDRIRFASAAAAIKSTRPGGQSGIPDRAAVEQFIRERER